LARAIHNLSPSAHQPFVAVHCAALSQGLIESELFGHERGAYTGAEVSRLGRFEMAGEGTLFLDEVGEIPLSAQVKLLRILENREFQRVGGTQTLRSEARVVTATHRDLEAEVAGGRFREDLYYRLSIVTIRVPPLRERREDIALLTRAFLQESSAAPPTQLTRAAFEALESYQWPGNVRELRNAIELVCVMKRGGVADVADLPESIRGREASVPDVQLKVGMRLDDAEETLIKETLRSVEGNRTRAAQLLGISRRTLQRKLREPEKDDDE
jgi:DNA-binding NtrC family response regulator